MLNVVLCWHMHQPDYRHQGEYLRPWTWLHAIKDYSDMAAHLERVPPARAVINFSPVLIEQLLDYSARIRASLDRDQPIGDSILNALAGTLPAAAAMPALLRSLLRVNEARMKDRFKPYATLHGLASRALDGGAVLARQQLDDLLVWYVLVWLGESLREETLVVELQSKAVDFSAGDRRRLVGLLAEVITGLLPRYRALAESGQVELSVTPYAHPILPLLLDSASAREAWPDVVLPAVPYPGGAERCDWHLVEAKRIFQQVFGFPPAGCWPSEGGISAATLGLLSRHGFRWTASGAKVLFNSLGSASGLPQLSAWQRPGESEGGLACFFRDDELSDRIGFEYSKWPAEAAVEDLVQRLEHSLAEAGGAENSVLSIIMDGENAWEYFPHNGWAFLSSLYARLGSHPHIHLTTFSDALSHTRPRDLPRVVAGSWVYGTFSTWVGDAAKNRAWDLLAGAKTAVDAALTLTLQAAAAAGCEPPGWVAEVFRQLAVCEASDWFWWLGDDNRLEDGPAFDRLFRQQLADLYELLGMLPPAVLELPVNDAGSAAYAAEDHPAGGKAAGAMRPADQGPVS